MAGGYGADRTLDQFDGPRSAPVRSEEVLAELALRIRPVVRGRIVRAVPRMSVPIVVDLDNDLYYLAGVDVRAPFAQDPVIKGPAEGLERLLTLETRHRREESERFMPGKRYRCDEARLFKPTVIEVLSQIPEKHLDLAVAFETVPSLEMGKWPRFTRDEKYQLAKTTLYSLRRR
jgi:hypothetical protein